MREEGLRCPFYIHLWSFYFSCLEWLRSNRFRCEYFGLRLRSKNLGLRRRRSLDRQRSWDRRRNWDGLWCWDRLRCWFGLDNDRLIFDGIEGIRLCNNKVRSVLLNPWVLVGRVRWSYFNGINTSRSLVKVKGLPEALEMNSLTGLTRCAWIVW